MKNLRTFILLVSIAFASVALGTVPSPTTWVQYATTTVPQTMTVPFVFQNASDLLVIDSKSGFPVTLAINSDYSVSGGSGSTGSITTKAGGTNAVRSGDVITITRNVPLTQLTVFGNGGPLTAAMIGQAFDKLTTISQQLNVTGSRSLQFQKDETLNPVLPLPDRKNAFLAFDNLGRPWFPNQASIVTSVANPLTVSSVQALRALAITAIANGTPVQPIGYWVSGDGGGGPVRYLSKGQPAATYTDDGGAVIVPSGGNGSAAWLWDWSGPINVRWYGAKGDGSTPDLTSVQAAVTRQVNAGGGAVLFPSGNFYMTNRLLVDGDSVAIRIDADATLTFSGVTGQQIPFGSCILITGRKCSVIGSGPSSLIQMADGSTANGITILHRSGGLISNLSLDGDKNNADPGADDTFCSGIALINDSAQNPDTTEDGKFTVENIVSRNWGHYGILLYGDLVTYSGIRNCNLYSNGKAADPDSVGSGIAVNLGVAYSTFEGIRCYDNKSAGFDICSAGSQQTGNAFIHCLAKGNGTIGFWSHEQSNYSSIAGVGQRGLKFIGCDAIGNVGNGFAITTADAVGLIDHWTIDSCLSIQNSSGGYGVVVATDVSGHVAQGSISNTNCRDNAGYGIGVGSLVTDTRIQNNTCLNNTGGQLTDSGSRSINYGNKTSTSGAPFHGVGDGAVTGNWTVIDGALGVQASGSSPRIFQNRLGVGQWNYDVDGSANLTIGLGGGSSYIFGAAGLFTGAAQIGVGVSGQKIYAGSGSPEAAVSAVIGSIYLRSGGGASTSLYVKEADSGANTGWVGK